MSTQAKLKKKRPLAEEESTAVSKVEFTKQLSQRLAQLYEELKDDVECRGLTPTLNARRKSAWERITQTLNAEGGDFTIEQVKKRWANMKSASKMKALTKERFFRLTDRGMESAAELNDADEVILHAIGESRQFNEESEPEETVMCSKRSTLTHNLHSSDKLCNRARNNSATLGTRSSTPSITKNSRAAHFSTAVSSMAASEMPKSNRNTKPVFSIAKSWTAKRLKPQPSSAVHNSTAPPEDMLTLQERALRSQIEANEAMICACSALIATCEKADVLLSAMQDRYTDTYEDYEPQ